MERKFGHARTVIAEDQLLNEGEALRRARIRTCVGASMLIVAMGFIFAAIAPLIVKENLPLLWVASANANGWSKYLQHIGTGLLSKGRIELFPLWVSYLALCSTALFAWFGAHLIRNRREPKVMGDVFTKRYWRHFYWIKKSESQITVQFKDLKKNP